MAAEKKSPTGSRAGVEARAKTPAEDKARVVMSQTEFPRTNLQLALGIATALWESYAGGSASPPDVAMAIDVSPTSSAWRILCGSSAAYGLTEGGYNATAIKLTPLGRRQVAPEEEGDDLRARVDSILKPRIMRQFFEKYRRAKLPNDTIIENVLVSLGVAKERAPEARTIIKENGKFAGVIRDTKTGPFVHLDSPIASEVVESAPEDLSLPAVEASSDRPSDHEIAERVAGATVLEKPIPAPSNNRVFITHGKQRAVVTQLKELLTFGQLEPVVSVERESTAIPVPEKVFEDMRSCSAGVIHVMSEGEVLDSAGNKLTRINENVLIEIGAAIALFGKKVILLVQKGVQLPSNLQGLYRCEYEGDRLDYDATMKLLKTFNQFR